MKDELISFETAKLAKEKGFNWGVRAYWFLNLEGTVCYESNETSFVNWNLSEYPEGYLSSPTQSLLQRWLRETYTIFIGVNVINEDNEFYFQLQSIFEYDNQVVLNQDVCNELYYTYEEALEVGLFEALNTIK